MADLAVARLTSVFFTTVMRKPFSRRRRRMPLFFVASIPRGLITATDSTSFNLLPRSRSIRLFTRLLMVHLLAFKADLHLHVHHHRGRHRALEHDLLEVRALARLWLEAADGVDHRLDVVVKFRLLEAQLPDDAVHV